MLRGQIPKTCNSYIEFSYKIELAFTLYQASTLEIACQRNYVVIKVKLISSECVTVLLVISPASRTTRIFNTVVALQSRRTPTASSSSIAIVCSGSYIIQCMVMVLHARLYSLNLSVSKGYKPTWVVGDSAGFAQRCLKIVDDDD